jgi:hypothetical protein
VVSVLVPASCVCQVLQKRSGVTQRVEGVVF